MNRNFIKIQIFVFTFLLAILVMVNSADAAGLIKPGIKTNINNQASDVGDTAGYAAATPESALYLVQTVINIFLSIIGVLLLAYILFAGYNWMTAQGEEEKVTKAKDTLKRAIIGVIIIIAAYAISTFVMSKLEQGTLNGGGGGTGVSGKTYP